MEANVSNTHPALKRSYILPGALDDLVRNRIRVTKA